MQPLIAHNITVKLSLEIFNPLRTAEARPLIGVLNYQAPMHISYCFAYLLASAMNVFTCSVLNDALLEKFRKLSFRWLFVESFLAPSTKNSQAVRY